MRLRQLVSRLAPKIELEEIPSGSDPRIDSLAYDSRQVSPGALFFALEGTQTDGHEFIQAALRQGAVAVASSRPVPSGLTVPWLRSSDTRALLALLATEFYRHPSRQLRLVGITGTNGKTTTAHLIHAVLGHDGPALLSGTINTTIGNRQRPSSLTTPEAVEIQSLLRKAWEAGCRSGVMEVSSHALSQKRVYGCHFPVAVFTNLSRDHLDYHGDMEEYLQAKLRLFQPDYNPGIENAVVNGDDPATRSLRFSNPVSVTRFGFSPDLEIFPQQCQTTIEGTFLRLSFFDRVLNLSSPLVGRHNAYNLMAAAAACSRLDVSNTDIQAGIGRLETIPGRFEKVELETPYTVVIDYAHTPAALESILQLCREVTPGRVLCAFGCGGDRDREKRPLMGRIAAQLADWVIVTSDNPRSENPQKIIEAVVAGIPASCSNFRAVVDRRAAIRAAVKMALPDDLVLVAGKGHETCQNVGGVRLEFDDRQVVREVAV